MGSTFEVDKTIFLLSLAMLLGVLLSVLIALIAERIGLASTVHALLFLGFL
jgi:hypothetical protein